MASVACCLFAQYSKEGLLPSVASSSIARKPVHKRKGSGFQGIYSSNYTRLSSVASKYDSDEHLGTCCIWDRPYMLRFRPEVFTNNNPSNTILVTYSTARFWVCGFTNHADLRDKLVKSGDLLHDWGQRTRPNAALSPKMPSPYLHPCANAFKMQPELHHM